MNKISGICSKGWLDVRIELFGACLDGHFLRGNRMKKFYPFYTLELFFPLFAGSNLVVLLFQLASFGTIRFLLKRKFPSFSQFKKKKLRRHNVCSLRLFRTFSGHFQQERREGGRLWVRPVPKQIGRPGREQYQQGTFGSGNTTLLRNTIQHSASAGMAIPNSIMYVVVHWIDTESMMKHCRANPRSEVSS